MTTQTVTIELSESLYRSANQIAQVTKRPLTEILQESLAHTLPPLEDVPPEEADNLALMSTWDDAALWQKTRTSIAIERQEELQTLLDRQSAGDISAADRARLHTLMDEYGRSLVHKSHALLLLARRGYQVFIQQQKPE